MSAKVEEERKDESPASWRLGLRKTGSYGALAEITATKEAQREKDTTGVMRSASSPRLSSSLDNKDKDKVNRYIFYFNIKCSFYGACLPAIFFCKNSIEAERLDFRSARIEDYCIDI